MKQTKYEKNDVRVMSPMGEFITLTKVSGEIPEYLEVQNGVVFKKHVDPTLKATIKTETIQILTPLAAAAGSWQQLPPFDFINIDVSPEGELPLLITYESVRIVLPGFDWDKLAGGPIEWESTMLPGGMKINGVRLLRDHGGFGI